MRWLIRYYAFLIVGWIGAWLLYESATLEDLSSSNQFAYWTTAKSFIWIAPLFLIVRYALRQSVMDYLSLRRPLRGAVVGLMLGAVFVGLAALLDRYILGRTYGPPPWSWGLLNAWLIAPLFEEIVFRGFVLTSLEQAGWRFWKANSAAALLFLGLHLPGWSFMGSLNPTVAMSIVLIGLVAGHARQRANSTWASVVFHLVNNLYSSLVL